MAKEIGISRSSVKKAFGQLLKYDLIQKEQLSSDKMDHVNYISLKLDNVLRLLGINTEPIFCNNDLLKQDKDSPSQTSLSGENSNSEFKNAQAAEESSDFPAITVVRPPCPAPFDGDEVWWQTINALDVPLKKTPARVAYVIAACKFFQCSPEEAIKHVKEIIKRNVDWLRNLGKRITLHFMLSYDNLKRYAKTFWRIDMPREPEKKIPIADRRAALRSLPYDIKQLIINEDKLDVFYAWFRNVTFNGHTIIAPNNYVKFLCYTIVFLLLMVKMIDMKSVMMMATAVTALFTTEIADCSRASGSLVGDLYRGDGGRFASLVCDRDQPPRSIRSIICIDGKAYVVSSVERFSGGGGRRPSISSDSAEALLISRSAYLRTPGVTRFALTLGSMCIPSSVRIFEVECFIYCESLSDVAFAPDSQLRTIEPHAFRLSSLRSICFPPSVEKIGVWCFHGCGRLVRVTFAPDSQLTKIEDRTFAGCSSLESICLPRSVEKIGEKCFEDCALLNEVTFERDSQVRTIENEAFFYCLSLASMRIPRSVEKIGERCFSDCSVLSVVTFESGSHLRAIGPRAFADCSLESICLPTTVETIGSKCFDNCTSLRLVEFGSGFRLRSIRGDAIPSRARVVIARH
jgi:hypothetical protein